MAVLLCDTSHYETCVATNSIESPSILSYTFSTMEETYFHCRNPSCPVAFSSKYASSLRRHDSRFPFKGKRESCLLRLDAYLDETMPMLRLLYKLFYQSSGTIMVTGMGGNNEEQAERLVVMASWRRCLQGC